MVLDGNGNLAVNVNGNIIPASYSDPIVVSVGDAVSVDLVTAATGQSEAVVTGRLTLTPRPSTGTVTTVPVGSQTITVTGSDGVAYTAQFGSKYTPTVNDIVILAWNAATPTVTDKVGTVAVPPPPPPPAPAAPPITPPPAPPQTGHTTYPATDSATMATYGWDTYATQGGNVYCGTYGETVHAAFWYAGSPKQLAGRTITRVVFTLGARLPAGNYNTPATINFYTHNSTRRPAGDITPGGTAWSVTIPANSGQRTFDLPGTFGAALIAGGGIAVYGGDYAGFNGRRADAASGKITLYWTR
jgi:hypothetical protein